jgi:hypothetical protein
MGSIKPENSRSGQAFLNRDYDSELGRFLQCEPEFNVGMDNLYGYVNNNPVNYTDITGLWLGCEVVGAWAMANWGKPTAWGAIFGDWGITQRFRAIPISENVFGMQMQKGIVTAWIIFPYPLISVEGILF